MQVSGFSRGLEFDAPVVNTGGGEGFIPMWRSLRNYSLAVAWLLVLGLSACSGPTQTTVPAQNPGISVEKTELSSASGSQEGAVDEGESAQEGETIPLIPATTQKTLSASPVILADDFETLPLGIGYEDAVAAMGAQGRTSGEGESLVCRWRTEGRTHVARFENGKLMRKVVLGPPPPEKQDEPQGQILTPVAVGALEEGMRLSDANALLGFAGELVGSDEQGGTAYRWRDAQGNRCTVWFEDDRLVRKSGLYQAGSLEETPGTGMAAPIQTAEKPAPASDDNTSEESTSEVLEVPAENTPAQVSEEPENPPQSTPARKVVVLGADRKAAEKETDTAPDGNRITRISETKHLHRAQLPAYSHSLRRGVYRVRFENTSEAVLLAGLRSGRWGQDVKVAPGQTQDMRLDRGSYHIFFIAGSDPYTLRDGGEFRLDGESLSDARVMINDTEALVESLSIMDLW